jgi:hypothetical protein
LVDHNLKGTFQEVATDPSRDDALGPTVRRAKLGAVHSGVHPPSRPKRAAHSRRQLPLRPAHRPLRACFATTFVPVSGECDDDNHGAKQTIRFRRTRSRTRRVLRDLGEISRKARVSLLRVRRGCMHPLTLMQHCPGARAKGRQQTHRPIALVETRQRGGRIRQGLRHQKQQTSMEENRG